MKQYPINVVLLNKLVVIIGGGAIAERKLEKLLGNGAKITVVSPEVTEKIKHYHELKKIEWKEKTFSPDDLSEAFLVIAATNCKKVNETVFHACNNWQLVNVVDNQELSNFIVPSTLQRGKLTISVSTSGASPGLAKKMIAEIAEHYDSSYEEYVDFLSKCRSKVLKEIIDPVIRKQIFKNLLAPIFFELTKNQSYEERETLFQKLLDNGGE